MILSENEIKAIAKEISIPLHYEDYTNIQGKSTEQVFALILKLKENPTISNIHFSSREFTEFEPPRDHYKVIQACIVYNREKPIVQLKKDIKAQYEIYEQEWNTLYYKQKSFENVCQKMWFLESKFGCNPRYTDRIKWRKENFLDGNVILTTNLSEPS
jgi:hypothetical protein